MKLVYSIKDITDLECALALAAEVKAEVGLTPDYIETGEGVRVTYDRADFKRLEKGDIGDANYIAKHQIVTEN